MRRVVLCLMPAPDDVLADVVLDDGSRWLELDHAQALAHVESCIVCYLGGDCA